MRLRTMMRRTRSGEKKEEENDGEEG